MIFKQKAIGVISLGCDKNRVDTEKMLAILGAENITNDISSAQIIIINSCAFLESARREAIETVIECNELRTTGKLEKIVLTGCLPEKFIEKVPSDGLSGSTDEDKLGFTYAMLDKYLREGVIDDEEKKAKIDRLHKINLFKLQTLPVYEFEPEK